MDTTAIRRRIEAALAESFDDPARRDIALHLTDWLPELAALVRVYERPDEATDDAVREALLNGFLHAPAHLGAATLSLRRRARGRRVRRRRRQAVAATPSPADNAPVEAFATPAATAPAAPPPMASAAARARFCVRITAFAGRRPHRTPLPPRG
jgi:hypothetical protein